MEGRDEGRAAEFFDGIDDIGLPFRWRYRDRGRTRRRRYRSSDAAAGHVGKAEIFDNNVAQQMEMRKFDITEVEEVVRSYVGFRGRIRSVHVPENWVKAWILLLLARPTPEIMPLLLGDRLESYFDGVRLPVISMGSGRIRELVRVAS